MIGWLKLVSSCKAILLRFERLPWGRPLCSVFAIIGESKFSSPNEMWRSDDVSKSVRCCDVVSMSERCCDVDAVASTTFDIVADCDGGRKEAMLTRFEVWLMMFRVDCSIREVVSTVSYFFSFTWKRCTSELSDTSLSRFVSMLFLFLSFCHRNAQLNI